MLFLFKILLQHLNFYLISPPIIFFQQWRLIPYLAATYVLEHFADSFFMDYASLRISIMVGDKSQRSAELGKEIHALSCASKPLAGWIARDGIQECREACGGHGYFAGTCTVN